MLISTINNISLMLCSRLHSRDIVCYQEADIRSRFINGRVTRFPGFFYCHWEFLLKFDSQWLITCRNKEKIFLKEWQSGNSLCLETRENLFCNLLIVYTFENLRSFSVKICKSVRSPEQDEHNLNNKSIYNEKFFH